MVDEGRRHTTRTLEVGAECSIGVVTQSFHKNSILLVVAVLIDKIDSARLVYERDREVSPALRSRV